MGHPGKAPSFGPNVTVRMEWLPIDRAVKEEEPFAAALEELQELESLTPPGN
jgi:hypothetical protein